MSIAVPKVQSIADQVRALWTPGDVRELRVLNTKQRTVSGYFDDVEALAAVAATWSGKAPGVYVTVNPVEPALLARARNRVEPYARTTTSDSDVARRAWLPIDCDATRPAGISSTDAEHEAALARGRLVCRWLIEFGVPRDAILYGDSGNGAHVLVRVDLPNDQAGMELIRRCLEALSTRYDDDAVHIDVSMFNASRIWKTPGTLACKGDNIPERPHRTARWLQAPAEMTVCPTSTLERLARLAPPARQVKSEFSIEDFIARHLPDAEPPNPWQGAGKRWRLETCLFNPDHTDSAALLQAPSGVLAYRCHHNTCLGKTWEDVRELLDPKALRAGLAPVKEPARVTNGNEAKPAAPVETGRRKRSDIIQLGDLLALDLPPVRWTVSEILPEGAIILAGKPKIGKSWNALGISIAIASGTHALGRIPVEKGRVLYLGLEDNERRLQERCSQVLQEANGDIPLHFALEWPRVDEDGITRLDDWMAHFPDTRLVVVDTLKRVRPLGSGEKRLYDADYEAVQGLQEFSARQHVTVLIIHHLRKLAADDPLDAISGTTGLAAAADGAWIMQRHRGEYDATLSVVHREGEDQELALVWEPELYFWRLVGTAEEHQLTKERREIAETLREAGEPMSARDLAEALEKNRHTVKNLCSRMILDGVLERVGRTLYRLSSDHGAAAEEKNRSHRSRLVEFPQLDAKKTDYADDSERSRSVVDLQQDTQVIDYGDHGSTTGDHAPRSRFISHVDGENQSNDYTDYGNESQGDVEELY